MLPYLAFKATVALSSTPSAFRWPLKRQLRYVEVPVKPWVHSKSGCLEQSGRRKFEMGQRSAEEADEVHFGGVPDEEDFVFSPGYLALWPHQSGTVEVTLRSREVGKYQALLEAPK